MYIAIIVYVIIVTIVLTYGLNKADDDIDEIKDRINIIEDVLHDHAEAIYPVITEEYGEDGL